MTLLWPNGKTSVTDIWWRFGPREPIWTDAGWTSNFHAGIDIGWGEGRDTFSPVTGTVILSAYSSVFGHWIQVREDGTGDVFWICHLDSRAASTGDRVAAGQYIGYMGQTGKASGNHWHYEVHPGGGAAVDPIAYYNDRYAYSGGTSNPTQSEEDDMAVMVTGGGQNLIVGGKLIPLNGPEEVQAVRGVQVMEVSPSTHYNIIQAFARDTTGSGAAAALPVLVYERDGDGTVYMLANGKLEALVDPSTLAEMHAKGAVSVTLSSAEVANLR